MCLFCGVRCQKLELGPFEVELGTPCCALRQLGPSQILFRAHLGTAWCLSLVWFELLPGVAGLRLLLSLVPS